MKRAKDGVLGFWGFGVLGFWGFGVLGFWGFGVLGFWGFGVFGFWGFGVLGFGLKRRMQFYKYEINNKRYCRIISINPINNFPPTLK
jgi:hypothetical protein